ncbi:hypothetical protein OXX80_011474 [Metschnikowia pulcherrima]
MSQLTKANRQFISNFKISDLTIKAKRDLILSILRSTTTKREAKIFLNKYQDQFEFQHSSHRNLSRDVRCFTSKENQSNVIEKYMRSINSAAKAQRTGNSNHSKVVLRVALFKITMSSNIQEDYKGIADTLNRLVQLGVSPIVVCGLEDVSGRSFKSASSYLSEQVELLSQFLSNADVNGFKPIQTSLTRSLLKEVNGCVSAEMIEQVLIPMHQGTIPIVFPIVYNAHDGLQRFIEPKDAMYHICSALTECNTMLSVEKVVFIEPLGGIPSIERNQTSHVFINLSQEITDIISELYIGHLDPISRDIHLANLESLSDILNLVSERTHTDETTGIITTPSVLSLNDDQLNPVVYNVLTDRPVISSSLPSALQRTPQISTSIVKKGFEVTVLDRDCYEEEFKLENLVKSKLLDKDKLVNLLIDSFGKNLRTDAYLDRIENSIATLIIVGDYEGAAIVTWEELNNGDKVAYLDKFAIAKRNQGIPGLADVIFKLITQSHQGELLWRSRANNPVNKWYFERCRGCSRTPRSPWMFFYTGEIYNRRMGTKLDGSEQSKIDITEKLQLYSDLVENLEASFY